MEVPSPIWRSGCLPVSNKPPFTNCFLYTAGRSASCWLQEELHRVGGRSRKPEVSWPPVEGNSSSSASQNVSTLN
ncbi:hypothetical protein NQZ68_013658 [Dissostichus eleginoides]|nr:hypothetical protein NQZ68_013658 [Dissostichus eleginoides]